MSTIDTALAAALRAGRHAIDGAMCRDRGRLIGLWLRWKNKPDSSAAQDAFAQALATSQAQRQARAAQQPQIKLDAQLPITGQAERITACIRACPVVIVAGETGSGKTTQLPKLCLAAGRGVAGMIGCTQPRRIAARAVAMRVAEELCTPLGTTVGFQVRFTDRINEQSRIKFMTDGILLAEIASDRWLSAYDTIIVDEAHERSLNIDFLLGYLQQLLHKRADLKLIVTSATIDTARFARYFGDAPVIGVEGRTYPVEVRYRQCEGQDNGERSVNDAIIAAIDEITRIDPRGDVLLFFPGEREIRDARQALERRNYPQTEVLPLYARLSTAEQDRIFDPGPRRRLVLATNVAETSLTVPRIRYVVDPGDARVKRYSPRQKLDRLHIEPISQASANQRMGRCGRIADGICYRLYTEADFQSRSQFTDPEIRRSSLAGVILRMLHLGLGKIEDFPFLETPDARAMADGWQQLIELGAIDAQRKLTATGRQMARLPVDVKLARMLVAAREHGCLHEMMVIAAFLGIQDPRERPPEARAAADQAHAKFADARSEFVGILRLWEAYRQAHEELTHSRLRDWCKQHFLGFLRMREWRQLHHQLRLLCDPPDGEAAHTDATPPHQTSRASGYRDAASPALLAALLAGPASEVTAGQASRPTRGQLHRAARLARDGTPGPAASALASASSQPDYPKEPIPVQIGARARAAAYQALHRALLAGLPTQIGHRTEKGDFLAPRQRRFLVFPGSSLIRKPPPWILSAALLDTQKIWGMTNATIEPEWVIAELPHLLVRKQFDPHWSQAQGRVLAFEQISLFGLVLASKKPIHYGHIDPHGAHDLFVRQALVTGEINTCASFLSENLRVLAQAHEEEAKLRRGGIVADEDWQARWYLDRIPSGLYSANALDAWWKTLSAEKRHHLHWSLRDLLPGEGNAADRYPKYFPLGKAQLALHYKFAPGTAGDGVTLEVPLHLLNTLDSARLSWLTPGFVAEKAAALIRSLPKAQRRNFVPAPEFGRAFHETFPMPSTEDFCAELAGFLSKTTGVRVVALDFDEQALEPHLRINLRLHGEDGKLLAESRDLDILRARFGECAEHAFAAHAGDALAVERLRTFPSMPIPQQVLGKLGVPAYPALVDQGEDVALRIFAERFTATEAHPRGVRRLLEIALAGKIKQARKQLPVSPKTGLLYAAIESQQRLREDLVDAALHALLDNGLVDNGLETIRDAATFDQRCQDVGKGLFGQAMQQLTLAESILDAVAALKPLLDAPMTGWARGNLDDIAQQLAALVYPGFLRDTPAAALAQYPRYLKAMILRTERAKRDPQRDHTRMLELIPLRDALAHSAAQGRRHAQWHALRWELEELRVSIFAQELGASAGISVKKLAQRMAALRD